MKQIVSNCSVLSCNCDICWYSQDSLAVIDLSDNKISNIESGTFVGLPNLTRVDLRNNSIKTLSIGSLKLSVNPGMQISNIHHLILTLRLWLMNLNWVFHVPWAHVSLCHGWTTELSLELRNTSHCCRVLNCVTTIRNDADPPTAKRPDHHFSLYNLYKLLLAPFY